jgi:hypothetical protein
MKFFRPDRAPQFQSLDLSTNGADSILYEIQNDKIILTLFNRLGAGYPNSFKIDQPVRNAATLPTKSPISHASRGIFEVHGKTYFCAICVYQTTHSATYQGENPPTWGYAFDESGILVARIECEGMRENYDVVRVLIAKILYEKTQKQIGAGAIKTTLGVPDLEEMTHKWTASISVAGVPKYEVGGDVSAVRKSGVKDPEKWQMFKSASVFTEDRGRGRIFNHIIAEDYTGIFHAVTSEEGEVLQETKARFFDAALAAAVGATHQIQIL